MSSEVTYRHVDVFADAAFRGNGLVVVFADRLDHPAEQLLAITAEMRQFETVFVSVHDTEVEARIFTVEEELPFAGHPVVGAAAALHERAANATTRVRWRFVIAGRAIDVVSERDGTYFTATMNQGEARLEQPLPEAARATVAASLALDAHEIGAFPVQVASTGLPYLIVPVTANGLAHARIARPDFETWLGSFGAKFVYVVDVHAREGRTWDNAGNVEDVATGSAAGPVAAYLLAHGLTVSTKPVTLRQGRFVGRPSNITVTATADRQLWVGGPVRPVAAGTFDTFPGANVTQGERG